MTKPTKCGRSLDEKCRQADIERIDVEPKVTMCNIVKPLLYKGFAEPPSSPLRKKT